MSEKRKGQLLLTVNSLLFIVFSVQVVTVFLIVTQLAGGIIFQVHALAGLVLIILVFVHFGLNFGWVKSRFISKRKQE